MAVFYDNSSELSIKTDEKEFEDKVRNNEMNPVLSVYLGLLNLGTQHVDHHNQQKYIRLCNFVTILTFLGSLIYVGFGIFWDSWYWLVLMVALSLTCVGVLVTECLW